MVAESPFTVSMKLEKSFNFARDLSEVTAAISLTPKHDELTISSPKKCKKNKLVPVELINLNNMESKLPS